MNYTVTCVKDSKYKTGILGKVCVKLKVSSKIQAIYRKIWHIITCESFSPEVSRKDVLCLITEFHPCISRIYDVLYQPKVINLASSASNVTKSLACCIYVPALSSWLHPKSQDIYRCCLLTTGHSFHITDQRICTDHSYFSRFYNWELMPCSKF